MNAAHSASGFEEGCWKRVQAFARTVDQLFPAGSEKVFDTYKRFAQLTEPARKMIEGSRPSGLPREPLELAALRRSLLEGAQTKLAMEAATKFARLAEPNRMTLEAWHRKPPTGFAEAAEHARNMLERFWLKLSEHPALGRDRTRWSSIIDEFSRLMDRSKVLAASRSLHVQAGLARELLGSLHTQTSSLDLRHLGWALPLFPRCGCGPQGIPLRLVEGDRAEHAVCGPLSLGLCTPAAPAGVERQRVASGGGTAMVGSVAPTAPVPPPPNCLVIDQVRISDWVTMKQALQALQEGSDRKLSKSTLRRLVLRDGVVRGVWDPDPRRKRKHLVGVMLDSLRDYMIKLDDREEDAARAGTAYRRRKRRR